MGRRPERIDILEILRRAVTFAGVVFFLAGAASYGAKAYLKGYEEKFYFDGEREIGISEEISVDFSVPIRDDGYLEGIRIYPETAGDIRFDDSRRRIIIRPNGYWQPETAYSVLLPAGRTAMLTAFPSRKISFETEGYPRVSSVSPGNDAKDAIVDTEDPIRVDFDKSTAGFYVRFDLDPSNELAYENNEEKTEFRLLPKGRILDGTHYGLKIYVKPDAADEGSYRLIYSGYFDTLPAAPVSWESDHEARLSQARRLTRPKVTEGKYIDVNLSSQVMVLFQDGQALDAYMVSTGKRGMETPKGEHQVYNKTPRAYSKEYGLYMPYWMAITADGKVGIHELPEWPSGYKEGAAHLGIPVSHGCIRLGVGPAQRAYEWADIGTKVVVY